MSDLKSGSIKENKTFAPILDKNQMEEDISSDYDRELAKAKAERERLSKGWDAEMDKIKREKANLKIKQAKDSLHRETKTFAPILDKNQVDELSDRSQKKKDANPSNNSTLKSGMKVKVNNTPNTEYWVLDPPKGGYVMLIDKKDNKRKVKMGDVVQEGTTSRSSFAYDKSATDTYKAPALTKSGNHVADDDPDPFDKEVEEGYNSGVMANEKIKAQRGKIPDLPASKQSGPNDEETPFDEMDPEFSDGVRVRREDTTKDMVDMPDEYEDEVDEACSKDEDKVINPEDAEEILDEGKYTFKAGQKLTYRNKPWTVVSSTRDWVEIEDKRGYTTTVDFDDITSFKGGTVMTEHEEALIENELSRMKRCMGEDVVS